MGKFTDDEICRLCGDGIEHHHFCDHDGILCGPCGNPACHEVKSRKIPGPLSKLLPVCTLCGPVGNATDADGVKEARTSHHQEVTR